MTMAAPQRNITEFFPTISSSKSTRKRTTKFTDDSGGGGGLKKDNITRSTPKRRTDSNENLLLSSSTKKQKTAATDLVSKRRIVLRNDSAVRKLQFDDNDGDQQSESFADFLRSKCGKKFDEKKSSTTTGNDKPSLINADEIKERLKGCRNLTKLKERLATINGCAEKVRKFKDMKIVMSPVKSPGSSKSSPRKTLFGSPLKSPGSCLLMTNRSPIKPRVLFAASPAKPTKKQDDNDDEKSLTLPVKFRRLLEIFKLIDYHCWRMYKRQEVCSFEKLKQVVEDSTRRSFTLDALLKVLTVDKDRPKFRLCYQPYGGDLKLVLSPVYEEQTLKCLNSVGNLLERERQFHRSLLERTKLEHLKYLAQMNLKLGDQDRVFRWHPMFPLESVPDIKPCYSLLPTGSSTDTKKMKVNNGKPTTILDYFRKQTKPEEQFENNNNKPNQGPPAKIESGRLKGISVDLLAKVRAKEAAKLAEAMKRPPQIDREIRMLSKLSQICRVVYDCFHGITTKSMPMNDLIERIADSIPMSVLEARRHLEYLAEFPVDEKTGAKWLQVINVSGDGGQYPRYVKIDTSYTLANIFSAFHNRMKKLQPNDNQ